MLDARPTFLALLLVLVLPGITAAQQAVDPPPPEAPPAPPAVIFADPPPDDPTLSNGVPYSIGEPTDEEQLFLEYINRARADAVAEASRLAAATDPAILSSYNWFCVDLVQMEAEFATLTRHLPPYAFESRLIDAARAHSQDMRDGCFQSHDSSNGDDLGDRLVTAGYPSTTAGENIFAAANNPWQGHAGFNVDWGDWGGGGCPAQDSDMDGMQDPPGHRLSIHRDPAEILWREIGIGTVLDTCDNGTRGPIFVTQDFGNREGLTPYITGVVYLDIDGDGFYSLGEGLGGVTVSALTAAGTAVTAQSGGYALAVPGNGSHDVTMSAPGMTAFMTSVMVSDLDNLKLDHVPSYTPPAFTAPPAQVPVDADTVLPFSTVPGSTGYKIKTSTLADASFVEGAEDGGANVTIVAEAGHQTISSSGPFMGSNSYQLFRWAGGTESVTLDRTIVPSATTQLQFATRHGFAASAQVARVQVSTTSGATWTDVWSQAGLCPPAASCSTHDIELTYTDRSVSLAAYDGTPILIRVAYDCPGSYFPGTDDLFGFHVDHIRVSNAQELTGSVEETIGADPASFTFHPDSAGNYSLQVAAINLARQFPYGPPAAIEAIPDGDIDGDTIGNGSDNCPSVANADQSNGDGDTLGDACDNCPGVTNQDQANGDGDTHGDACDNCPSTTNEDQANGDGDTQGDACDNCPGATNQDQANGDGDTLGDACDNCPSATNENQANGDGDTQGDACDNCPGVTNQDQANGDGDTIGDLCDNCPGVTNEDQANPDGDSAGSACEDCDTDPDKLVPGDCGCNVSEDDSDGDGTKDCLDDCPADPDKHVPGVCGCGVADIDRDGNTTIELADCSCKEGDVHPHGSGDQDLGLADWVVARRKTHLGSLAIVEQDRTCGDVWPGQTNACSGGPTHWCVTGDGAFDANDTEIIRALSSAVYRASCDACPASGGEDGDDLRLPADVAPRGGTDNKVDISDVLLILRWAVGLDSPPTLDGGPAEEWLRADIAPATPDGDNAIATPDGQLDISDVLAVLRAAVALAPLHWPERGVEIRLENGDSIVAFSTRMPGWPSWAAISRWTADCGDGGGLDESSGTCALTCASDPAVIDGPALLATVYYRGAEALDLSGISDESESLLANLGSGDGTAIHLRLPPP